VAAYGRLGTTLLIEDKCEAIADRNFEDLFDNVKHVLSNSFDRVMQMRGSRSKQQLCTLNKCNGETFMNGTHDISVISGAGLSAHSSVHSSRA
jgi:hypothetical protein